MALLSGLLGKSAPPAAAGELIKDSDTQHFVQDVIEASQRQPVIVDFWAPWCGPCKQLGPILEKAVNAANGAVRMVKLNIDENPEIAQQMRIQSIPTVYAFKDGPAGRRLCRRVPESQIKRSSQRLDRQRPGRRRRRGAMAMAKRGRRRRRCSAAAARSTTAGPAATSPTIPRRSPAWRAAISSARRPRPARQDAWHERPTGSAEPRRGRQRPIGARSPSRPAGEGPAADCARALQAEAGTTTRPASSSPPRCSGAAERERAIDELLDVSSSAIANGTSRRRASSSSSSSRRMGPTDPPPSTGGAAVGDDVLVIGTRMP